MHTPAEAIAELEHCVQELGLRAVMIAGCVRRPIAWVAEQAPALAPYATWLDTYGLDSAHDYDPFWRRCQELGVSLASHGSAMGWDARRSISNYMYNQIGHFAAAGEALCKSLFMGGVTRRFPGLRFAFLEGGVGWACALYAEQLSHWSKRNRAGLERYDPAALDRAQLAQLLERHAAERGWAQQVRGAGWVLGGADVEPVDDWAPACIDRPEDIHELFVPRFFFGCEADDPLVRAAFDARANPLGARLGAMFGSDIGHWDVPDMAGVLAEAWEPVAQGRLDESDFRDFTFTHAARFYTDADPGFFRGTSVENAVAQLLGDSSRASPRIPDPGTEPIHVR
jgi:hypothetical protein